MFFYIKKKRLITSSNIFECLINQLDLPGKVVPVGFVGETSLARIHHSVRCVGLTHFDYRTFVVVLGARPINFDLAPHSKGHRLGIGLVTVVVTPLPLRRGVRVSGRGVGVGRRGVGVRRRGVGVGRGVGVRRRGAGVRRGVKNVPVIITIGVGVRVSPGVSIGAGVRVSSAGNRDIIPPKQLVQVFFISSGRVFTCEHHMRNVHM